MDGNERTDTTERGVPWQFKTSKINYICNVCVLVDIRICVLCAAKVEALIQQGAKPNAVDPEVSLAWAACVCMRV